MKNYKSFISMSFQQLHQALLFQFSEKLFMHNHKKLHSVVRYPVFWFNLNENETTFLPSVLRMVRVGFFWFYAFNPLAKNGQWLLYHRVFSWLAFHGFHEGSKTNGKMHAKIIIKCLAPLHILSFLYVNSSWYSIDGKTSLILFYIFTDTSKNMKK